MIIDPTKHSGISPQYIPMLEEMMQGTYSEMLTVAEQIFADRSIDVWNCKVYRSTPKKGCKRLRIVNHACNYVAIIEWCKPYDSRMDFKVILQNGCKPIKEDNPANMYHDKNVRLYINAVRYETKAWCAYMHKLPLDSTLLSTLRDAILTGEKND